MNSLRTRLLLAAALVLAGFVALTGAALERAFQSSLLLAQEEKMRGLVYSLLGAASLDPYGELSIALDNVPDPRLRTPLSGLEAALFNQEGRAIWSSVAFLDLPPPLQPEVGEWQFERLERPDVFTLNFGLRWIDLNNETRRYTVVVLEDASAFEQQTASFRRALWGWLGATVVGLTTVLLLLLRWGLAPLNRLGQELHRVETGAQMQIEGQYPLELRQLTQDLNAMIVSERNLQTRYRNALGDLAHTLKTPLAVLRGAVGEASMGAEQRSQMQEQLTRMQHIVDNQMRRAAAVGSRTLSEPILLRPLADKLFAALAKVYADKALQFENQILHDLRLRADQGDLYELLGNLLDNAAKYGRHRVRVSALAGKSQSAIIVEDDGPGFPYKPENLLSRGARADTMTPGQGIGLATVSDLVKAYDGKLLLDRSSMGGAKVMVTLPGR